MAQKLTQRDKKLLVFLAVFVMVIGLGAGVIYPLAAKSQELQEKLTEASLEQAERQQKITALPAMEKNKKKAEENLAQARQEFYEITPSMGIDKMLTEMAVSRGVVVKELNISMPAAGEYTQLSDYADMLLARMQGSQEENSGEEAAVYGGIYTAEAKITMTGQRQALQDVLDTCAALEPKMRIDEFLWQSGSRNAEGEYTLSMALELYMAEDTGQYVNEQQELAEKEQDEEENSGETAEEQ